VHQSDDRRVDKAIFVAPLQAPFNESPGDILWAGKLQVDCLQLDDAPV
jgi:hypothetical protein